MARIVSSVLLAGVALLVAMPGSAAGQSNVPPGNSEIDQYLPTVPDSEGDKPFGGGGGGEGTALPPSVADRLGAAGPGGAAALSVIEQTAPKVPDAAREQARDQAQGAPGTGGPGRSGDESVAGVVVDALGSGDSGGMGLLLPILLGVVAGAGVFLMLRRRLSVQG